MVDAKELDELLETLGGESETYGLDQSTDIRLGTRRVEEKLKRGLSVQCDKNEATNSENLTAEEGKLVTSVNSRKENREKESYKKLLSLMGFKNVAVTLDRVQAIEYCIDVIEDKELRESIKVWYNTTYKSNKNLKVERGIYDLLDKFLELMSDGDNKKIVGLGLNKYMQYKKDKEKAKNLQYREVVQISGKRRVAIDNSREDMETAKYNECMAKDVREVFKQAFSDLLVQGGYETVGQVYKAGKKQIRKLPGVGKSCLDAITVHFIGIGLNF